MEVEVPFTWGYHNSDGPGWKINENNKKEIKKLASNVTPRSIYSVDTFNSNTQFQKIKFSLKIKKRNGSVLIGIINNVSHKHTEFTTKEIPNNNNNNNNEMKIKQNMYYCINACDGQKSSHVTNHKCKSCMNTTFNSGDILTFTIDFLSSSISCVKNNNGKTFTLFENIKDIQNTNWRLVVSSRWKDDCVELLSCKGIRQKTDQESKMEELLNDKKKEIDDYKKEKELNVKSLKEKKYVNFRYVVYILCSIYGDCTHTNICKTVEVCKKIFLEISRKFKKTENIT